MVKRIKIIAGNVEAYATLNDTETAKAIWEALPIRASAQTWGDEIYFGIPVDCGEEKPQEVVQLGELGYWEPGSAFCIFFGPTPMSHGDEIRPASPVTVFGKIEGDPRVFKSVKAGTKVIVERAE
ncbi:MAG: hypothetical protein H5T86_09995 [Armatimonadetes bacterium]|nr:hypothetical protein [Armatimonadota bacterium]